MNVFELQATLGLDSSGYSAGLGAAKNEAHSFASSFKKIIGGIAIAGGAGLTLAGGAVVSVVKSAVTAYKDYEQLVGGVQTLFGNGGKSFEQYAEKAKANAKKIGDTGKEVIALQEQLNEQGANIVADGIYGPQTQAAMEKYYDNVLKAQYDKQSAVEKDMIDNAWSAYDRAGMDANQYMETVTSFSASLIQSVGGDTERAVGLADQAIVDMSDNANKMGTDIEAIQVAYAGFAKQNYTMLDNLKLGYGGTKSEMERLIKRANELRVAQGLTGDLTIEKYSDVIEAIHEVQTELGITGTTAEEANTTIEGSFKATKSAWKNLMIAFAGGRDVKQTMGALVTSARHAVENVVPVVSTALQGVSTFFSEVTPIIAQELPTIISESVPSLLSAVGSLASAIVTNFPAMLSGLGSAVAEAITGDPNADFGAVAGAIIDGINAKAGELAGAIKLAITGDENADWGEVGSAIIDSIQNALQGGANIIKEALGIDENFTFDEIGTALSTAVSDAKTAIEDIDWSEVGTNIANKVSSALNLVISGMKGIFTTAKNAIYDINWSDVGTTIWNLIKGAFVTIGGLFEGIFGQGVDGALRVDWAGLGSSILDLIVTALSGIGETIFSIFESAWNDISNNPTLIALGDSIKQPFTDAIDALKADWEAIGDFFSGIWEGITSDETLIRLVDVIKKPFEDAKKAIDDVIKAISDGISSMISKVGEWTGIDLTAPFSNVAAAATEAFNAVISVIQSAIDKVAEFVSSYSKVNPDKPQNRYQQGYDYFNSQGHATAMAHGEILQGITPFGVDGNGTIHYGGEAGPEAVVGVNSLDSMIQQSVNNAVGAVLSRLDTIIGGQNQGDLQVVLDSGVLVGQMARGMDKQMGKLATWRGGGRA